MEVQSARPTKNTQSAKPKMSKEQIEEMVKAKFGDKAKKVKKAPVEDKVEIKSADKGVKNSEEADFGDVKSNNPNAAETREKLKEILKTNAFSFNDGERRALADILDVK